MPIIYRALTAKERYIYGLLKEVEHDSPLALVVQDFVRSPTNDRLRFIIKQLTSIVPQAPVTMSQIIGSELVEILLL